MSHYCYIIYSANLDSYYVGETEDLQERLKQHCEGFYSQSFTKRATDWELFLSVKCKDRVHARKIESHIKRMKTKKYLFHLKTYPEILDRLYALYL